ncbi:hypothetical protein [Hydrogenophilus thermoluteolus]|uniref:hypothetical protein n=1 Tax=Hydrogenophilus thermoluteolus TaxID=297 RepID=UPI002557B0A3|nr:hypothetical protein [Hydrogenophilus thermoluteolus]
MSRALENYVHYRRLAFALLSERFPVLERNHKLRGATLADVKAVLLPFLEREAEGVKRIAGPGQSHESIADPFGRMDVVLDDTTGVDAVHFVLRTYDRLREITPDPLQSDDYVAGGAVAMLWGLVRQEFGQRAVRQSEEQAKRHLADGRQSGRIDEPN